MSTLGSACRVKSLWKDAADLCRVVDGFNTASDAQSWKYPTVRASEVNTEQLLQNYRFSSDEDDGDELNRRSHVGLMEVIIDRLLLIIHLSHHSLSEVMTKIQPVSDHSRQGDQSGSAGRTTNIGLTVTNFWRTIDSLLHWTPDKSVDPPQEGQETKVSDANDRNMADMEVAATSLMQNVELLNGMLVTLVDTVHNECRNGAKQSRKVTPENLCLEEMTRWRDWFCSTLNDTRNDIAQLEEIQQKHIELKAANKSLNDDNQKQKDLNRKLSDENISLKKGCRDKEIHVEKLQDELKSTQKLLKDECEKRSVMKLDSERKSSDLECNVIILKKEKEELSEKYDKLSLEFAELEKRECEYCKVANMRLFAVKEELIKTQRKVIAMSERIDSDKTEHALARLKFENQKTEFENEKKENTKQVESLRTELRETLEKYEECKTRLEESERNNEILRNEQKNKEKKHEDAFFRIREFSDPDKQINHEEETNEDNGQKKSLGESSVGETSNVAIYSKKEDRCSISEMSDENNSQNGDDSDEKSAGKKMDMKVDTDSDIDEDYDNVDVRLITYNSATRTLSLNDATTSGNDSSDATESRDVVCEKCGKKCVSVKMLEVHRVYCEK